MATGSTGLIVAAFDFGTTYSGYAFSFKDSPNAVITNKNWTAGSGKLISLKTPTSVLLNENAEFDSFGFDAEDKYSNLAADGTHHGWRLFRRFKMILHNIKVISRSTTVEDLTGKSYPAMPIFTMSIGYLQKHLLKALDMSRIGVCETDIRYIITVPAIWGIAAKQFMREAAIEAGIDDARLKLALEPEAAAVCCEALEHISAGQKFMVVDVGGGTADISVHEKQDNGSLKNIYAPSGGPWGGIYVDENFTKFLSEIFGPNSLSTLKTGDMYDYFEFIRDFEVKKRNLEFRSQADITFRIPFGLTDFAKKHFHQPLSEHLTSLQYGRKVFTRGNDKLGVNSSILQDWFSDPVFKMVKHIQNILLEERLREVSLIILVGGFAESVFVQHSLKKALPGMRQIVPADAGLAVLKGAVMFGHRPDIISSRVMDYTYGMRVWRSFDENKYPVEKKVFHRGKWSVDNVFKIFVRVGDDVPLISKVTRTSKPTETASSISIYRTKDRDPVFTTDPGCEFLGEVIIENNKDIPLHEQKKKITFMLGDTELFIEHTNIRTGEVTTLAICLND